MGNLVEAITNMKKLLLVCLALLSATPVSAQRIRTIPIQTVFVTYVGNRTHWTDPVTAGPQFNATANGFWHSASGSWGAITLVGSSWPTWVDSSQTMPTGCNLSQILLDVRTTLGAWIIPGGILHVVLPPGTPCYSLDGGSTIYTIGGGAMNHEIGHWLGLPHAGGTLCTSYAPSSCITAERGDDYDIMGSMNRGGAIHVAFRQQLGVYSPTFQLAAITTTQDVTLQTFETMTPGIKGVVASMPGDFAHRLTAEFHGGDSASIGVIIHGPPLQFLLTMNPLNGPNPWVMRVGQTYCLTGYVCVTNLRQDANTATLHIAVGADLPPSEPTHLRPVLPSAPKNLRSLP